MSKAGGIAASHEGRPPSARASQPSCGASRPHHRPVATCLAFDPHQRLFAECVASALAAEGLPVERAHPSTGSELLDHVRGAGPAVYLVDGVIFESGGGAALVERVHERGGKIVVVAASRHREHSASCSAACADGVVSAAGDLRTLVSAVGRAVRASERECDCSGDSVSDCSVASSERQRMALLSPRERVVLESMMNGMSAPDIARAEFVAVPTVRSQIRSILGKLQVNSQLAAVAIAHRAGWNAAIRQNHQI